MMKKYIQLHVLYSGRVQGVGFRFTIQRIAAHYDITGFVRNLSDGTVELVAQGEKRILKEFLEEIRQSNLLQYISNESILTEKAIHLLSDFTIRF